MVAKCAVTLRNSTSSGAPRELTGLWAGRIQPESLRMTLRFGTSRAVSRPAGPRRQHIWIIGAQRRSPFGSRDNAFAAPNHGFFPFAASSWIFAPEDIAVLLHQVGNLVFDDPGEAGQDGFERRYGNRLAPQDVARVCHRLARQACAHLGEGECFHLTPHMLRHTFLKRVADLPGVHVAQQMSGNVSIKEIFRYTKPGQDEMDETAEGIYG
jgi:hypothetical protein